MSIKLVAFDLDGTLLDSKKNISSRNIKALAECVKRGIHIVPATGRTILGVPKEIKNLPGVRYAITLNGGVILDMKESAVIDEQKLDHVTALEILDMASEFHVMYDVYIDGDGISESGFYDHLGDYNIAPEIQKLIRETRKVVPDIKEFVREYANPVEKVNLYFDDLREREKVRHILGSRLDVIVSSSIENNLEINAIGATKGEGLTRLASHLGVAMGEIMACGDGENDFSMIQMAGVGVVMNNGDERLKALADYVTDRNDEDGVARAIERFVLC